jgi:hypothetical protein
VHQLGDDRVGDKAHNGEIQYGNMMNSARSSFRFQVSLFRGAWVVTIYDGEHTENRSFCHEIDARDYAKARVDQLRSGREEIRIDPKFH